MPLIDELNRVLRYGLAPIDELKGMAEACHAGGTFDATNTADAILADKLEDHDDPRATIVRRDLGYRQHPSGNYSEGYDEHRQELLEAMGEDDYIPLGSAEHRLPDGTLLRTNEFENEATGKSAHRLHWILNNAGAGEKPHVDYDAVFTPEEFKHIMTELGLPH